MDKVGKQKSWISCLLVIYGLETVLSVLFSNIATPHTLPARLLSFGED